MPDTRPVGIDLDIPVPQTDYMGKDAYKFKPHF